MAEEQNTSFKEGDDKEIILVAEDSPPNRKILVHLLEKLNFKVISCENGKEAWDRLSGEDKIVPVAVISDIMMPEMDGIELLKNIRNNDSLRNLPTLLVTAVSDRDYIMEAKELDVNGYILKPVTFQRVLNKLRELFPEKKFPKLAG